MGRVVAAALFAGLVVSCGADNAARHEATKPPNDVLAEAVQALRATGSYHVSGMLDPGFSVDIDVTPRGSAGSVTIRNVRWDEVAVDGQLWFRGAALWRASLPSSRAKLYDEHWVHVLDKRAAFGFAGRIGHLNDSIPGIVFGPQHGLTNTGAKTVDGQRVVELTSDEDIYDVLVHPPRYPVRWLEKENPGPNGQPCGITLSRFGAAVTLRAPTTTLELRPAA